jgi:tetratricopeptide (TPR) repeat protein
MLATIYGRRGQFSRAVEEIKSSLTFGPFADGWACLGDVFYDEGKKDSALICYRNAMAMHPEDPQTLESIADNFFHLDQFKEAEHALQESLRLRNEHGRTHYELGLCEAALKKNKEAIAEYKLAIKYDPDFPPAHYSLGLAYLNDLHDKPAALDEYKILLPLDKDIAGLLFQEIYK